MLENPTKSKKILQLIAFNYYEHFSRNVISQHPAIVRHRTFGFFHNFLPPYQKVQLKQENSKEKNSGMKGLIDHIST